jgi:hypothetical protein
MKSKSLAQVKIYYIQGNKDTGTCSHHFLIMITNYYLKKLIFMIGWTGSIQSHKITEVNEFSYLT